jgi:zinc and cadmium transporter
MAVAWLLTLLALGGVMAGLFLGQSRALSSQLAAAGGGLLFGIAVFWLIPEIAETSGWTGAFALALASGTGLAALDMFLVHTGYSPRHGVVGPLLLAVGVHSFLDGWSLRAVSAEPVAAVAVPLGLALHKVPEGIALGWITRQSLSSVGKAAAASIGVELLTVVGASIEHRADTSGAASFGPWWTAGVLAIIAGSFLFLGLHAVLPARRNTGIIIIFFVTLLAIGGTRILG